ncbi:MAG: hypothetical protein XU10_C0003G0002 [Chloroflexi bacterium CSP1-4]|nr:MAG: hypothetical protein XU10_C0003G0002 [Chloroflexi bacterium CSP1-4]
MRTSPRGRPIDLSRYVNASTDEIGAAFHPLYRGAIERLPAGAQTLRGLPFLLAERDAARRWLLVREPIRIELPSADAVSHVVIAHFCDAWRAADGTRPAGLPVGWVVGTGQPLGRYVLERRDGAEQAHDVRRRFEVNEGIVGWGQGAFAALSHRADEPLDWRGPHPAQGFGRYAGAGHAGPLTTLPGTWFADQTGVVDSVPSPDDDALYWLFAMEVEGGPVELEAIRLEPPAAVEPGGGLVVAAITLYAGSASPLRYEPRRTVRVSAGVDPAVSVDLGVVIRRRRASVPVDEGSWSGGDVAGWGESAGPPDAGTGSAVVDVDVAMAPDALLEVSGSTFDARRLAESGSAASENGRVTIESLPPPSERLAVAIRDAATGERLAARIRFVSADGRYLPPLGHRDEVNPGLGEDAGGDLLLGASTYAYVDGDLAVDLPPGPVFVEVVRGFEYRPHRGVVDRGGSPGELTVALERVLDTSAAGWVTADSHVHLLSPSTALLQAAAEGVNVVHLLATQWGDHFFGVTDLRTGTLADREGRHMVCVGTENRQNMLGHLALVGARRPVLPMASGGPPEGRIGGSVDELMADWADRCHESGGMAIAAHFPLPYSEVAADIVRDRIDAVEVQCFAPGLDNPTILEWYRYLNCGYRLPIVGGTDRMSAEVPVGAVRTYARLADGDALSFDTWAAAVRAGRTFATSGPIVELAVDGHEPGDVLELPSSGGRLPVRVRVRAAQPVITGVELVVNGAVVASVRPPAAAAEVLLEETVAVGSSSWIAARSLSDRVIQSAFATSMAAHTSPVYVEVTDRPLFAAADADAILTIIDGTRTWIETLATIRDGAERERQIAHLREAQRLLLARREDRLATSARHPRHARKGTQP